MTLLYQLNNLQYDYGKNFTLSLPDLRILSQKITVLIGENGSGKSTLLNLLALQVFPTNGSLRFLDQPISKKQRLVFQKKIGFLPQKPYVFRGSVKDNLALALKFHHVPKKKQIEKITIILAHLKITHLGEQWAKSLSGGELQKVAIARVLITEPRVLLMDEPFSYLDSASILVIEAYILNYLAEKKASLVFSSHDHKQGLAWADEVISLVAGKQVLP